MKRTRLAYPYIFVWMPLFIVAPMLFVAYYAFFDNGTFTTEYVKQVFSSTTYLPALWNSIWIALATTAVCLLAGYPVAYILSNMKKTYGGIAFDTVHNADVDEHAAQNSCVENNSL